MAAVENVGKPESKKGGQGSSLASPATAPVRGVLKILVRASSSRSATGRFAALLVLLGTLLAFAFLGFYLPSALATWSGLP